MATPKKLTVNDIEVPEGMLDAAWNTTRQNLSKEYLRPLIVSILLYASENPRVPTDADYALMAKEAWGQMASVEWQRRMWLKPTPELPDDVLKAIEDCDTSQPWTNELHKLAAKAYALGQQHAREKGE